jgi:uncharacterized membrane protein YjgN (DUF898 family)
MTAVEVSSPIAVGPHGAAPDPAAGGAVAVQFLGNERAYWRLRVKGAALVVLTLGIYRFWLATDVRRFLWSNTEIAGDTLEYNGLATELLVGFLLAVAIIVPLYMTLAIVALELDSITLRPVVLGFILLAALGEFALYRARRYRLTRTVFRGVRFDQHGAAWNYALRALAWWVVVILTLGLAYPWSQANLQRFKLRNTSYGDVFGRFEGSGLSLFMRGLPMWFAVIAPLVIAIVSMAYVIDWDALSGAATHGDGGAVNNLIKDDPQLETALGLGVIAAAFSAIVAVLLYPVFQAVQLRWWLSGLRVGAMTVTSRLRVRQVYWVYLRFLLCLVLFAIAVSVVAGIGFVIVGALVAPAHDSNVNEVAGAVVLGVLYIVVMLGASVIYQVVIVASLWRLGAQSAELMGAAVLDNVRAAGVPSSALGEGLADALGVGSM